MADIEVYKRMLDRERKARREAEQLLERKSLELYNTLAALKVTAAELHDEVEKTRAVLRTAADGILAFDADGTIEAVNPAAERIFECDGDSLLGEKIWVLLPAEKDRPNVEHPDDEWWTEATATEGASQDQVSNKLGGASRSAFGKRRSGEVFEMELSASRVQLEERWLYTWIVRDVTKRRNLERQLSVAQRLESVGQLAAGVAHEINTPIQFVGDNLEFLKQSCSTWTALFEKYERLHQQAASIPQLTPIYKEIEAAAAEAQLDFLQSEMPAAIEQSVEGASRVAKIIRSMKEFSHPGGSAKVPVDLNQAIESTVTVSRNEWKYVADVQTDLDPSIPPLVCYPGDLNQALLNLIVNAAQAIAEHQTSTAGTDGEVPTITIATRRDGDEVEICIADTGPGMPPEIQGRVFDPFFTTKAVGVGTGQGLSIVHSVIVERHNGKLHMDSKLGTGTTFTIRLPLTGISGKLPVVEEPTSGGEVHADSNPVC